MAFIIAHGGRARIYTHLSCCQDNLHKPKPSLVARWFAHTGDLINSQGYLVKIIVTTYTVPNANVTSITIDTIMVVIAAKPASTQMGTYAPRDTDTESLRTRRICPTPHLYGGLWTLDREWMTRVVG